MKAAVLEDVKRMVVRQVPDPAVSVREVLLRVQAVGVCGTDLHLFQGHGNYNFDADGRQIPLTKQPQILGHEFTGEVVEVGREVKDLRPGDRVVCDQGRNCLSHGRHPICSYCASGDSHQCAYYREHGITGLPGALAEYISMPAVNCLEIPGTMTSDQGALVEPFACVLHASARVEHASARYTFNGQEPIRNILICGAGPAGLLFLQYLKNVKRFNGQVLITDLREKNLELAARFGGTTINASRQDLTEAVRELTHGEGIHYMIEACGNAAILGKVPSFLCKQGTILLYGAGHRGQDISVIDPILFLEPSMVISIGASGGFGPDGRPTIYRRALELVSSGQVQVLPFITHRYPGLEEIHKAFEQDFQREDYIKGVLSST